MLVQDGTTKTSKRWKKYGIIVESLPNRQYHIKLEGSGRITLRNRRFIKPTPHSTASPLLSPAVVRSPTIVPLPEMTIPERENEPLAQLPTEHVVVTPTPTTRVPRSLKCLADHNTAGTNELPPRHSRGNER